MLARVFIPVNIDQVHSTGRCMHRFTVANADTPAVADESDLHGTGLEQQRNEKWR